MNQHDETRRMLDLIRESKKNKNVIKESRHFLNEADDKSSTRDLDPEEYKEEERKFRESVSPRVKFNSFRLYPKSQNVEFSGLFTDNNVEWFYSLDDTMGCYMSANLLQLNEGVLKQIQKLVAYYETWANEWGTRISEEYSNDLKDEENEEVGPESLDQEELDKEEEPLA